mgnify:CR=1 FL=1
MARKKQETEKVIVPSLYNDENEQAIIQDNALSDNNKKRKINKNLPSLNQITPAVEEGLNDYEVEERMIRGLNNAVNEKTSKTILSIVLSNIFNIFNLICVSLAVLLFIIKSELSDFMFILPYSANIAIGIFQEIRSKNTIDKLSFGIIPKVKVIRNGNLYEINSENIVVDDILILENGQQIPADGIVRQGKFEVNEAMITGESMPVYKKVNDMVLAGTTIVSGNIHLKVNKTNENTYLSLLIKKVEDIQANKPRLQRLADKIASIFVPAVISISLITFIVTFIINKDLATSINRAIAVLMVSCPCSLGLATPLSILVGSSRAINLQIIYNNTEIFEKASHINTICFDKTGTLSKGTFVVSDFESNVDNALDIIYTLESVSNHPIATSLVKFAKDNNAKLIKELKPKEIIGKGIECDDYFIYKENQTVKLLYKNEVIATLTLKDEIKEEAKEVIKQLHKQNIEVYILTGDSKDIAISVANELNIKQENVFYEIKPEDKLSIIENLKDAGKKVAFVGDGINDALALNKADLSISMGNGSDIAKSSSDITLTNSSLSSISSSIKLSKKVYINIIENFIWAFSYNIVAIPLAFIGILSPLIAGICMAFSNISVVLNALRLYKVKIGERNGN